MILYLARCNDILIICPLLRNFSRSFSWLFSSMCVFFCFCSSSCCFVFFSLACSLGWHESQCMQYAHQLRAWKTVVSSITVAGQTKRQRQQKSWDFSFPSCWLVACRLRLLFHHTFNMHHLLIGSTYFSQLQNAWYSTVPTWYMSTTTTKRSTTERNIRKQRKVFCLISTFNKHRLLLS